MLTVALSVLAALANACSSVLQRRANQDEPDERSLNPRLILDLAARPVWLGGVAAVIVGFLLQAAALSKGQIALVQPLLVLELPITLLVAWAVFHSAMHRREWLASGAMTAGLILLVTCLGPSGGRPDKVRGVAWAIGIALSLVAVGVLVGLGRRYQDQPRAALLGAATGTSFGLTAALMSAMSSSFSHGLVTLLSTWQTYAMVVTGAMAMYLLQSALQAGLLVAAQPGITLSDPVVAIVWGVALFGEKVRSGPWILGTLAGAVLLAWGTVGLSRSPLMASSDRSAADEPGSRDGRPSHDSRSGRQPA